MRIRQLVLGAASDSRVFKNWCLRIPRPVSEVKSREKRDEQSAAWRPSLWGPVGGHPRAGPHSTPPPRVLVTVNPAYPPQTCSKGQKAMRRSRLRGGGGGGDGRSPRVRHSPPVQVTLPRARDTLSPARHCSFVRSGTDTT